MDLDLKFFYRHYKPCLSFLKQIKFYQMDTRKSESEKLILKAVEDVIRSNSYASGLTFSIFVASFASVLAIFNPNKIGSKPFLAARYSLIGYLIYKQDKVFDLGSHIGIWTVMPEAFNILTTTLPENSAVGKEARDLLTKLIDEDSV